MPNGDNAMAQAVYLAQLFAARGNCNCKACQLLRKVSDDMTDELLAGASPGGPAKRKGKARAPVAQPTTEDLLNLGGEQ